VRWCTSRLNILEHEKFKTCFKIPGIANFLSTGFVLNRKRCSVQAAARRHPFRVLHSEDSERQDLEARNESISDDDDDEEQSLVIETSQCIMNQ